QRLVFPSLDIARGPIVEQAESGDVVGRVRDGNRRAERVAGTDPNAKLELVVEAARGAEARSGLACGLTLAVRAAQRGAGDRDRGGAAVITDRHVFVVRQQRIVGSKELARIGGVVNAGEEIGVVADRGRKLEAAIRRAVNKPRAQRFYPCALA